MLESISVKMEKVQFHGANLHSSGNYFEWIAISYFANTFHEALSHTCNSASHFAQCFNSTVDLKKKIEIK